MPLVYVFYQFFYPDEVVSSVHFTELCTGLVERGWDVTAYPSTRDCRKIYKEYSRRDQFQGAKIRRIWRPAWRQSAGIGRILNAAWMLTAWARLAMKRGSTPDVVILGTDPIGSILIAIVWRFFKPKTTIVHWCFDLYPEAAYAEGLLDKHSLIARVIHPLLRKAYLSCDLIVDIGPCMRELLLRYDSTLHTATLVPWALDEPSDVLQIPTSERKLLFGDAPLGLLYSGSFGRAHSSESLLKLIRVLKEDGVRLAFSVRGNREHALRTAVQIDDSNVTFAPFAAAEKLAERLACANVHVVSLRDEWTGAIVPSKSFGALAIGRPLLFCGDPNSSISRWIEKYNLGWVLTKDNVSKIASDLRTFMNDPDAIEQMNQRCQRVYQQHFSRQVTLNEWHRLLTELLSCRADVRSNCSIANPDDVI